MARGVCGVPTKGYNNANKAKKFHFFPLLLATATADRQSWQCTEQCINKL
jgi:hypothetical protein